MITIYLRELLFHSFHGVHEEEKLAGGEFEVNLEVSYQPASLPVINLNETVNYVSLYELVKQRMEQPTALLETIATEIAAQILAQFSMVEHVQISITKLHPPIAGMQGSVGVSFTLKKDQ